MILIGMYRGIDNLLEALEKPPKYIYVSEIESVSIVNNTRPWMTRSENNSYLVNCMGVQSKRFSPPRLPQRKQFRYQYMGAVIVSSKPRI